MSLTLPKIWAGIEIGWPEENPPDDECIEAATRLLEAIWGQIPLPKRASRGYWQTVYFDWNEGVIGLETTWSKYEVYIFKPGKEFDVWDYEVSQPDALSDLVKHLSHLVETR
ncbi:hypothetical protein [Amaricoccus sp.]|uniref:hypothetical protein n=1 Tax=Amaricoccus sp. TaxID=1872485 RepID=UPI001B54ADE7|nr:hypothetical protein [Amaricoccus sp.]MBP7003376.1 hypothetical protein [Amaricoccus sp.]